MDQSPSSPIRRDALSAGHHYALNASHTPSRCDAGKRGCWEYARPPTTLNDSTCKQRGTQSNNENRGALP